MFKSLESTQQGYGNLFSFEEKQNIPSLDLKFCWNTSTSKEQVHSVLPYVKPWQNKKGQQFDGMLTKWWRFLQNIQIEKNTYYFFSISTNVQLFLFCQGFSPANNNRGCLKNK